MGFKAQNYLAEAFLEKIKTLSSVNNVEQSYSQPLSGVLVESGIGKGWGLVRGLLTGKLGEKLL